MTTIYLYAPQNTVSNVKLWGVNPTSVEKTRSSILNYGIDPNRITILKDPKDLSEALLEEKGILVIPNGNFIVLMSEKLKEILPLIRQAIAHGWNYLGIGSGALLGSKEILWKHVSNDHIDKFELENDHLLKLLDITAIRKISSFVRTIRSSKNLDAVSFQADNGLQGGFPIFWNEEEIQFDTISVDVISLGSYKSRVAHEEEMVGVKGLYHQGKVVLFGFSLESAKPELEEELEHYWTFLGETFSYLKIL